jgi:copper(I)-binding protein
MAGERETAGAEVVAGALVMEEDWARAPAAKAMRAAVYFILNTGSRDTTKFVREDEGKGELYEC